MDGGVAMDKRKARKMVYAMLACEGLNSIATGLLDSCDFSDEDKRRIEEAADEIGDELRNKAGDDVTQEYLRSCGAV